MDHITKWTILNFQLGPPLIQSKSGRESSVNFKYRHRYKDRQIDRHCPYSINSKIINLFICGVLSICIPKKLFTNIYLTLFIG